MTDTSIRVNEELSIPAAELSFRASRSGGPGGQHVNTSSTRVELVWDVEASVALTPAQRDRIRDKLATRISGEGLLTIADSSTRSQHRNREEATQRFADLLRDALEIPKPRRKTKPTRASKEERLKEKRHRSEAKRLRRSPEGE